MLIDLHKYLRFGTCIFLSTLTTSSKWTRDNHPVCYKWHHRTLSPSETILNPTSCHWI